VFVRLQITVAKNHSQKVADFTALKAARLPACNLNNYVEPPLNDGVRPLHIIVTTPDRFDTCYQKQVNIACMLLAYPAGLRLGIVYSLYCGTKPAPTFMLLKKARTTLLAVSTLTAAFVIHHACVCRVQRTKVQLQSRQES
jgi:hypothetical protein